MLDFSLAELLLVIVVSVVFIGPKDLPVIIKALSKAMNTLRGFTHEIKQAFDDISRESGLHDAKETLDAEMRLIKGDDGKYYESYDIKNIDVGTATPPDTKKHDRPDK